MDMTACFTGHRPQKLPWGRNEEDMRCRIMKLRLISAVFEAYNRGYRRFISGMADGVDIIAAEAVLKLRENCGDVRLECALPFPNAGRTAQNAARYDRVLSGADGVTTLFAAYHAACMAQRNRYMVDNSSLIIAVYGGSGGGTRATLKYAEKRGLEIVLIDPRGQKEITDNEDR